jgi:hypothetical protein
VESKVRVIAERRAKFILEMKIKITKKKKKKNDDK